MMTREQNKQKLLRVVAEVYNVTVEQLQGIDRTQPLPEARAVVFYIGTRDLGLMMHEAGALVNRKHSNAVTQGNKIEYKYLIYPDLRQKVDKVRKAFAPEAANPYFEMFANLGGYEGDKL